MGQVHIQRDFFSSPEGYPRTVRVYTPDAYEAEPERRFPVLYMQDGQHVFAHPESARWDTWCANVALEGEVAAGRIEPWIIVAVDHGLARFDEYSPWDEPKLRAKAKADAYGRFLVEHLKPWVDRTYRTRTVPQWTGIAGSSLGGLVALWLGRTHPEVFGRIGAFSPSVMWSEGRTFEHWNVHLERWIKLYVDAGEHEATSVDGVFLDYGQSVRKFGEHLRRLGYGEHELRVMLEPGGEHDERAWQRRLPEAFAWLLATE